MGFEASGIWDRSPEASSINVNSFVHKEKECTHGVEALPAQK